MPFRPAGRAVPSAIKAHPFMEYEGALFNKCSAAHLSSLHAPHFNSSGDGVIPKDPKSA